jgi:hypothetical protein
VENGLGLTTITGLLTVITSLTLSEERSLTGLVLSDLVGSVLSALGTLTVGVSGLGNVDLWFKATFSYIITIVDVVDDDDDDDDDDNDDC